jgi:hypothetical protein
VRTPACTPAFCSPEAARSERPTAKSDVWGLGCTALHLLSGALPWSAEDSAFAAMYKLAGGGRPPPPPGTSMVASAFLAECLEPDAFSRASSSESLDHPFLDGSLDGGEADGEQGAGRQRWRDDGGGGDSGGGGGEEHGAGGRGEVDGDGLVVVVELGSPEPWEPLSRAGSAESSASTHPPSPPAASPAALCAALERAPRAAADAASALAAAFDDLQLLSAAAAPPPPRRPPAVPPLPSLRARAPAAPPPAPFLLEPPGRAASAGARRPPQLLLGLAGPARPSATGATPLEPSATPSPPASCPPPRAASAAATKRRWGSAQPGGAGGPGIGAIGFGRTRSLDAALGAGRAAARFLGDGCEGAAGSDKVQRTG